jgi:hypothetical protein
MPPAPENRSGAGARDAAGPRGRLGSSSSGSGGSAVNGRSASHGANGNGNSNLQITPPAPIPTLASLGRTYRLLGAGPSEKGYLGHDECKRFLKITPELYTRDNLRKFEKRVDELKAMAREVVRPLMGSGLELEMIQGPGAAGIGYLTCTTLRDRDLPWGYD